MVGPVQKPLIGVLASHDSKKSNEDLANLFAELYADNPARLMQFHFVFTGGTFERIILAQGKNACLIPNNRGALDAVNANSTQLPSFGKGGVTILANLVVQRQCHIVWAFLSPNTTHWLNPENLALMRLVDTWKDKCSMTPGSVRDWFSRQADDDAIRNLQDVAPLRLYSWSEETFAELGSAAPDPTYGHYVIEVPPHRFPLKTVALVAHDDMKPRMVDFAVEFENELATKFDRILTTSTTGQEIQGATRRLKKKIRPCRSGPKGGDVEIATEILFGRVDVVIFFVDPLHPHPHIDDVRTVFSACMRKPDVLLLTNEVQARGWIRNILARPPSSLGGRPGVAQPLDQS